MNGFPVLTGDEQPASVYCDETPNQTTTITRKSVPSGALWIEVGLFPSAANAPTAKFLYVVVGAASNSEEDYLMSVPSGRICVPVGEHQRIMFPTSDLCMRYAITTDAATESVGNLVIQRIGGVL